METSHFPTTNVDDDDGPWAVYYYEYCMICGKRLVVVCPVGAKLPEYYCQQHDPHAGATMEFLPGGHLQ